jgi:hypothetical protein
MAKFKKTELSEEELTKAKQELEEKETSDEKDDVDDEKDDEEEAGGKKEKKSFDELCKDKVKEKYIKKENLSEISKIIPEGVSEEFVSSFDTIVTSLVNEQIEKIGDALIADFMEELDNREDEIIETQTQEIEKFISVELDKFKEEQKEQIVSNLKLEKAEKFLDTLKSLFAENHYILDTEKLKQVEEAETKIKQLEDEINKHYTTIKDLKEAVSEKDTEIQLNTLFVGLTEMDKSRLKKLLESHDKADSANYIKEAQRLKDYVLSESTKNVSKPVETEVSKPEVKTEEEIVSVTEAFSKLLCKKIL